MSAISASGRDPSEVTLQAIREGMVAMADVSIHPATLEHQAKVAEAHKNPQLASNFRRAAELTLFADDEVLKLYEALRPRRSTAQELDTIARQLESRGAVRSAALFREAAEVYARRGLLKP